MGTRKVNTVGVLEVLYNSWLSKFNRSVRVQRDTMGLQLSVWIIKVSVINGQDLKQFLSLMLPKLTSSFRTS